MIDVVHEWGSDNWTKMSVLLSKISGIGMVMWSDHLYTEQKKWLKCQMIGFWMFGIQMVTVFKKLEILSLFSQQIKLSSPGVDFINYLRRIFAVFAPCAQLSRLKKFSQKFGAKHKHSANSIWNQPLIIKKLLFRAFDQ